MEEFDSLIDKVRRVRRNVDRLSGEARLVATQGKQTQEEIAKLEAQIELHERVSAVLSGIGEKRQMTAQSKIETLVTHGLQTVFGAGLSFHIVQSMRGKTVVAEFLVRTTLADGRVIDTDVMSARGGGLAAVVGFLLRLVVLLLSKQRQETLLILDEPFTHLSKEYVPLMAEFLRELADKTGIQILLVSHQDELTEVADKRYRFSLDNHGWTVVTEV